MGADKNGIEGHSAFTGGITMMLVDRREPTRIETIIDLDVLRLILDSFFAGWKGSYYVMPADAPERRLLEDPHRFSPFCDRVRHTETGRRSCHQHDLRLAKKAFRRGQAITTVCYAGMLGFVIPIFIDGEPLATIFFGQGRSWLEEQEENGRRLATKTESDLGFEPGTLLDLRERSPKYTKQQFQDIKSKLARMATYVSELGHEKTEAQETKKKLEMQLRESEAIREVVTRMMEVEDDWPSFWVKVDDALVEICTIIGARFGVFITYESQPGARLSPVVKAVGNLERQMFVGKAYPENDPLFQRAMDYASEAQPPWTRVTFHKHSRRGTICYDIKTQYPSGKLPDVAVLLPIDLGDTTQGILVFFLDEHEDVQDSLAIEQEMEIILQVAPQIALAYQNSALACRRRSLAGLQTDWLENVSHQLLAPLTSIEGHAERLYHRFRRWLRGDIHLVDSTLETLMASAKMTARLARNFAWIATDHEDFGTLDLVPEHDLVGLLIACARNFQGLAAERKLRRVHVDKESLEPLDRRVALDRRLFSQAVSNLLDNAVKYADKWTEVVIHGEIDHDEDQGLIHVTNEGIPITEDQVEKIFERGYRTPAAVRKYSVGTGIGLTIARDIISLHNGELTVEPSTATERSAEVTFTIQLPLTKRRTEAS